LAERLQHGSLEFRQLVEEENAMVSQGNLARGRMGVATEQASIAGGVVRGSERAAGQ
jgi:hypothetical protein